MTTGLERFASMTRADAQCLVWTGSVNSKGYALFSVDGRVVLAHRWAYERKFGPIPAGMQLDHVKAWGCQHRNCVNVDHLEPVTARENNLRGDSTSAVNARKTHCNRGHALTLVNTYLRARGHRECRACRAAAGSRRRVVAEQSTNK